MQGCGWGGGDVGPGYTLTIVTGSHVMLLYKRHILADTVMQLVTCQEPLKVVALIQRTCAEDILSCWLWYIYHGS